MKKIKRLKEAKKYVEYFKKVLLLDGFSFQVEEYEGKKIISIPNDLRNWTIWIPKRIVRPKELKEEIVEELVWIEVNLKVDRGDISKWVTQIVIESDIRCKEREVLI